MKLSEGLQNRAFAAAKKIRSEGSKSEIVPLFDEGEGGYGTVSTSQADLIVFSSFVYEGTRYYIGVPIGE